MGLRHYEVRLDTLNGEIIAADYQPDGDDHKLDDIILKLSGGPYRVIDFAVNDPNVDAASNRLAVERISY